MHNVFIVIHNISNFIHFKNIVKIPTYIYLR